MFNTWGRTPSTRSGCQAQAQRSTLTAARRLRHNQNRSDRRKGLRSLAVTLWLSWAQPGPYLIPDLCKPLLCAFQRLGQLERLLSTSTGWQLCAKTCCAASPVSDEAVRHSKEKPLQCLCQSSWNKSGEARLSWLLVICGFFFFNKSQMPSLYK